MKYYAQLTIKALKYFHINQEAKSFSKFEIIDASVSAFHFIWIDINLQPLYVFFKFQCGFRH